MSGSENSARALRGELYYAFTPELSKQRRRCAVACSKYNAEGLSSRRKQVEMWRDIVGDSSPLPDAAETEEEDEALFAEDALVEPPIRVDYGTNLKLASNVFINSNCTILDTCLVSIGARTLIASNVSLYGGTHPLDPDVRSGTQGPEYGKEIHIEEDCWIGGSVVILPGVTIGKGSTVGAGSVVTKNVPPYKVVAGNPARILRDAPRNTDEARTSGALAALEKDQASVHQHEAIHR